MVQFSRLALISTTVFGLGQIDIVHSVIVNLKILNGLGGNEIHRLNELKLERFHTFRWLRKELNLPPLRERIYPGPEESEKKDYIRRHQLLQIKEGDSGSTTTSPIHDEDTELRKVFEIPETVNNLNDDASSEPISLTLQLVIDHLKHDPIPHVVKLRELVFEWTNNDDRDREEIIQKYGPIEEWDISKITNLSYLFDTEMSFNEDISLWNTSNVTNMSYMFRNAVKFNQDVSLWKTSNVINMSEMFLNAFDFDQNIGKWNVSNVIDMSKMFAKNDETLLSTKSMSFNQDLSEWIPTKLQNAKEMFLDSTSFNSPIWDWKNIDIMRDNINNFKYMFEGATSFDQDVTTWEFDSKVYDDVKLKNELMKHLGVLDLYKRISDTKNQMGQANPVENNTSNYYLLQRDTDSEPLSNSSAVTYYYQRIENRDFTSAETQSSLTTPTAKNGPGRSNDKRNPLRRL